MHETRNFALVIVLLASVVWAIIAWTVLGADATAATLQRFGSLALIGVTGLWLLYALCFEDKMPNHLRESVGGIYYEADGVSFLPMVRLNGDQAEICVYYQNRFENFAEVIVHLRPPEDGFLIRPNVRDVHFAFKAEGGDYGVIHQPIAVPRHLQGEVVHVKLAAASYYPRSHGARLRRDTGMPCGTLLVDWGGAAFKTGVHEVSGEIELTRPVTLHLAMPPRAREEPRESTWKQERLATLQAAPA